MNELVEIRNGQPITTSVKIADYFQKEHSKVIRTIEKVIADYEEMASESETPKVAARVNTPMFQKTTYTVEGNFKEYPMYLLNKKAFALTAMRFNGKKAFKFQSDFFDAFTAMEQQLIELLAQRKSAEWLEARNLSKVEFRKLTDLIRDKLIPLMIKEGASQNAIRWVYKNYVSMIQKLLGIDKGTRDNLPPDLLYELGKVEQMTMIIIKGLIAAGRHSKQIYLDTKQKICSYAQLSLFNQRFIEGGN